MRSKVKLHARQLVPEVNARSFILAYLAAGLAIGQSGWKHGFVFLPAETAVQAGIFWLLFSSRKKVGEKRD